MARWYITPKLLTVLFLVALVDSPHVTGVTPLNCIDGDWIGNEGSYNVSSPLELISYLFT